MTADSHHLDRFVAAQADDYDTALAELRSGRKKTDWIWYVFPQIEGLGKSDTAQRYAISSLAEAAAYLEHPVLGPRLVEATEAVLSSGERDPDALFGHPDTLKFRSSMTLFSIAGPDQPIFRWALEAFYGGTPDDKTLHLLEHHPDEADTGHS